MELFIVSLTSLEDFNPKRKMFHKMCLREREREREQNEQSFNKSMSVREREQKEKSLNKSLYVKVRAKSEDLITNQNRS